MAILIDANTKVICQGITGSFGALHTRGCYHYGTKMVGGVTPGKGGTKDENNLPIFNTVAAAVRDTGADATMIFVPPPFTADAILEAASAGVVSLAELDAGDPTLALFHELSPDQQRLLREQAPEHVTLFGGRSVEVHYEAGKPPWIASRLQDFFGMADGPRVAKGRVPVTLHLLAPNRRAVQVTSDLAGFWERHYPALRRELGRRYPKHSWPEDGRSAKPPAPGRLR